MAKMVSGTFFFRFFFESLKRNNFVKMNLRLSSFIWFFSFFYSKTSKTNFYFPKNASKVVSFYFLTFDTLLRGPYLGYPIKDHLILGTLLREPYLVCLIKGTFSLIPNKRTLSWIPC